MGGREMGTDYAIRLAEREDIDQLPAVERSAASIFGDSLPESVLSHVTPIEILRAAQEAGLLWVAVEPTGTPVGFAVVSTCGTRVHLDELDVRPEHGRRGVGSSLVHAVEDYARKKNFTEITLTTFRDVPWNAPFYARLGFESIPERQLDAELLGRLSDESALGLARSQRVAMRKPLDRSAHHPSTTVAGGATTRSDLQRREVSSADRPDRPPDP